MLGSEQLEQIVAGCCSPTWFRALWRSCTGSGAFAGLVFAVDMDKVFPSLVGVVGKQGQGRWGCVASAWLGTMELVITWVLLIHHQESTVGRSVCVCSAGTASRSALSMQTYLR